MTDEQPHTPPGPLTDTQRTRLEFAQRDLDDARSQDLSELGEAGLILLVERLRTRLSDTLSLIAEISKPPTTPM